MNTPPNKNSRKRFLLLSLAHFLAAVSLANVGRGAPPKVDTIFPAGAGRGQTVSVLFGGAFGTWPAQAWCDRPGVTLEPEQAKGKYKATVSADAEPGIAWLRVADAQGASTPRPFAIGTLPEVNEEEPNDGPEKVQRVTAPAVVNGRFNKAGDVDVFALELGRNQTLVASLLANRTLGSPCDAVLQIASPEGFVLAQNDDARGIDPEIVFVAPRDGTYLVRAFAFPLVPDSTIGFAGGDSFIYRLTLTTGGFVNHTLPLFAARDEPTEVELFGWNLPAEASRLALPAAGERENIVVHHALAANALLLPAAPGKNLVAAEWSSPKQPQPVELPAAISGVIEAPQDVDAFAFSARKGARLAIQVESFELGYPLDPFLQVQDAAGKVLAEADDSNKRRDAELTFSVPADGEYHVLLRDLHRHGGPRYAYRLSIKEGLPDFELKLAADSFVLAPGKSLEIPVAVERRNGFSGEIEIAAVGLPDGVTAAPARSLAKGDSAKSVKLSLNSEAGPLSANIRIVGTAGGDTEMRKTARYPLTPFGAELGDVWLTVEAKK